MVRTQAHSFAPAWLGGDAAARALLPGGFERGDARAAAARSAATRRAAPALVDELRSQQPAAGAPAARDRHLEALAAGGAATVISGQQVGLFTGPAFSLYKAAGVVAAARQLSAESGLPCVPLFWLQTEDHDWPEIDHCFVRGAGGSPVRIELAGQDVSPRVSVAARRFDSGIEDALKRLDEALAGRACSAELLQLLRRHYADGVSPAAAFRGVLAELFADDGLLFFDPRTAAVATLTRPLLERTVREASAISETLVRRAGELAEAGFAVQVPVRPDAPLCFFHPDGPSGPRYRLEPRGEVWRLCDSDREVDHAELLRRVDEEPLCLSSSALLRSVVQDSLFPNAMVLGGPGEIAYFAQLPPLYEALGVEMPLVAPRPSFCVTEAGDRRRLEALSIGFGDLAAERDALLARLSHAEGSAGDVRTELTGDLVERLEQFSRRAVEIDPNLAAPIRKTRDALEHSIARLANKYERSLAGRDTVLQRRLDELRGALAPGGVPQERCYGFASLAAQHGVGNLLVAVGRTLQPFDGALKEIAL